MPTELYPKLNEPAPGILGSSAAGAYDPANIDTTPTTVGFDPAAPVSTTQGESSYVAPEYTPPEQTSAGVAPGYDTSGLLDASVADINKLTSGSSALMRGADTRAQQAANERGLLSSSMAVGAAEAERLNTVMPLVQQTGQSRAQAGMQEAGFRQESNIAEFDAATAMGLSQQDYQQQTLLSSQANAFNVERENAIRGFEAEQSGLDRELQTAITDAEIAARIGLSEQEYKQQVELSNQANTFAAAENALSRSHEVAMEIADSDTRKELVDLEQKWNQRIQTDVNLAAFWQSSIDGIMDIMNNPELEPEQQQNAMNEMIGYTDADDIYHVGTVEAGLNFLGNLTGGSVGGGVAGATTTGANVTGTNPTGAPTQGSTNTIGAETGEYSWDSVESFPPGKPGDVSPDGKYEYVTAQGGLYDRHPEGWRLAGSDSYDPYAGGTYNANAGYISG